MDGYGHVRAYMQHVADAAQYSTNRDDLIDVMGDGPQVRQQLDNVQRVSATRAWRCLLLLGATGMLAVACSLHWRYSCVLLHVSGFCAERSRTATTAERYLIRVDAMGDGSQVLSKATRHSTAQICHTRMVLPAAAGLGSVVTL